MMYISNWNCKIWDHDYCRAQQICKISIPWETNVWGSQVVQALPFMEWDMLSGERDLFLFWKKWGKDSCHSFLPQGLG